MKSDIKHDNKKHKYPPETAGRLMVENVPVVNLHATIGEIEKRLYQKIRELETINYIYVVDKKRQLVGVISIKDILRQPKDTVVAKVMIRKIIYTHPHTDQERVAYMSLKHNIKSVPVVDKHKIFLGVVPSDIILSVMYEETHEDLLRLAGIRYRKAITDNVMEMSLFASIKRRTPWLFIGLAGGIMVASIIGFFEHTLEKNLMLAAFIPLVVYMSDAVRIQMEAFIIRDIALNPKLKFSKYFTRQFSITFLIALMVSGTLYFIGFAFYHNRMVANVVGVALFVAIISSVTTGLIVPYLFNRLKLDPANASGPIATIIQDFLSVTIYFSIASVLL